MSKDLISSDLDDDEKNNWGTDPVIFKALDLEFGFVLDAAASEENALCPVYLTSKEDALKVDWSSMLSDYPVKSVFINPPYGRGYIKRFMNKCIKEKAKGVASVMLVPATLEAGWLPIDDISEIRVITGGRLGFYHPITKKKISGNTKGSMLVIFRPSKMPLSIQLIDRDELLKSGEV